MPAAPDSGDAWAPAKPRLEETLIRELARAHWWKQMLEEGRYRSAGEVAEAEGVTRSYVNRLLRTTRADFVEVLTDGSPKGCSYAAAGPGAGDAERMGLPADDQELWAER
jgi:hypothetical protein